jgi:hypothetical protein
MTAAASHASAPAGCKCADCTIDGEACPTCYAAWWKARHANVEQSDAAPPSGVQAASDAKDAGGVDSSVPIQHPADKIGRAKLVMAAIDDYHDRPTAQNRQVIRTLLMELLPESAGEQTVQQTIIAYGITVNAGFPVIKLVERIAQQLGELNDLRAQIAAAPPVAPAPAREGWKLVPLVPTKEMIDAWANAKSFPDEQTEWRKLTDDEQEVAVATADWQAMFHAAPPAEPPAVEAARRFTGVGHLEETGYIPAGSAAERAQSAAVQASTNNSTKE